MPSEAGNTFLAYSHNTHKYCRNQFLLETELTNSVTVSMNVTYQDLTLVGGFNPAIITPDWLRRENIYSGETEIEIDPKANLVRYLMPSQGIYWNLTGQRMTVYSKNPLKTLTEADLRFVKDVFERLQHTPIQAIGYNRHMKLVEKDCKSLEEMFTSISRTEAIGEYRKAYSAFTNKFENNDKSILINFQKDQNGILARINVEHKAPINGFPTIKNFIDNIEKYQEDANRYIADWLS